MCQAMEAKKSGGDSVSPPTEVNGALPSGSPKEGLEEPRENRCGWGPFRPESCQVFRSPKVFLFWLCWTGALQGMIVNGFVSVCISTIERRFNLASYETGFIASAYDIAAVLCLIPVSYFGGCGRKPRWLGFGIMILGSGSILFALPHFMTGPYEYESSRDHRCYLGDTDLNRTSPSVCVYDPTASKLSNYKYVLIMGQLLHGIGASPLYTLGVTYLDENLKAKMTPLYVGIFYAMAIVGPAVGYVMGGEFLKYYADIDLVPTKSLDIDPDSPKWVGAWWIGFMISGCLAILVSFPILGFPRALPGSEKLKAQRESEVYCRDREATKPMLVTDKVPPGKALEAQERAEVTIKEPESEIGLRDILNSLRIILTNPTFMFLNLAGASEGMLLSGFTVFTPKFIESQFSISAGWAAQLVGLATIPAGGGGTFLGGYLVKRLDLRCRGILRLCLVATFLSLVLILVFLIQCPPVEYAGVTTDYVWQNQTLVESNLTAVCNMNCQCLTERYDPICGINNVMYFSPCHAGCFNVTEDGIKKTTQLYSDCKCISASSTIATATSNITYQARAGKCESDCRLLALFLPMFALVIMCTFTASMPALSATLRCVPEKQRSFALGIQWIIVRCLGTIPAPIIFGAIIDMTCRMWQNTCDGKGSCYHYNNGNMGRYLLSLAIGGKVLSCMFFICSASFYRPPPSQNSTGDSNGNALTDLSKPPGEVQKDNTQVVEHATSL